MFTLQLVGVAAAFILYLSLVTITGKLSPASIPPSVATLGCAADERRVNYREATPKGNIILPNAVYLFVVAAATLKNSWVACDCLPDVRRISKNISNRL